MMAVPAKGREEVRYRGGLLKVRVFRLFEPALQPPDRHPACPRPIAERDESQKRERVVERHVRHLAECELSRDQFAPLDRPLKP
jgi:hypothetical protein